MRPTPRRNRPLLHMLTLACLGLGGCTNSPSIAVFGAYFPDWMFCWLGGLLSMLIVRQAMGLVGLGNLFEARWRLLADLLVTAVFALLGWLIFF